jgi:alpha-amylase
MRTICLYFQIHQPFRLKRYRFFNIGNDHYYYDDYMNESIMRKVADRSYLIANKVLRQIIKEYGSQFRVAFSISGIALDQFELYTPDVLESFQKLAKTGSVEFLAETYSHSLVALKDKNEFRRQVDEHRQKIKLYFNCEPTIFRNTELVYSDNIGADVADMGFSGVLTEGAKHVLGWKSPNYMYCNAINPRLKVLLRNFRLSDDIAFRFSNKAWSEFPLTAEKFVSWLNKMDKKEEIANIFIDYETFGEHQWLESGIFDFLRALPGAVFRNSKFTFGTPGELVQNLQPISSISVPYPISWADEERDLTAWLGNDLQKDAFNRLYSLTDKVNQCSDPRIRKDWRYLQSSDHLYYMSTKFFSDGEIHAYFNPYESPYDAYINYMNVLSDFSIRLNALVPETVADKEIVDLSRIIDEKQELIRKYELELKKLKSSKAKIKSVRTIKTAPKKTGKTTQVKKTTNKTKAAPGKRAVVKNVKKTSPVKKNK